MKGKILQKTREQGVRDFIKRWKYLANPKYFKTNKISAAHWESWAAQGKAGGCCICNVGHYNYSLHNKRYTTTAGGKGQSWSFQQMGRGVCSECYTEIEKQCNYSFTKF